MADPQPDNTEWVVVAHYRIPIDHEEVLGHYPTAADAAAALNAVLEHPTWFTTYNVEHRNKE